MKVIWSGAVRSESGRTDRTTGQLLEYRLIVYDDGQASCTCPGFTFAGLRNPNVPEGERLRVRCKHLIAAFRSGAFALPDGTGELGEAGLGTPGPSSASSPTSITSDAGRPPVDSPPPQPDLFPDDWDDLDEPHRLR